MLELSGIGDPEVLKAAGVDCVVENKRVGANFQDHVLGGMLYDLAEGVQVSKHKHLFLPETMLTLSQSLDSMHNDEFAQAATKM